MLSLQTFSFTDVISERIALQDLPRKSKGYLAYYITFFT